ncbi:MAG: lytic transglycosylase domain-containing protein, partial [Paracoccaceae bacterium]|nr:lytic transglycosylase domain-containing protein [Paracoccaceae bacterium]
MRVGAGIIIAGLLAVAPAAVLGQNVPAQQDFTFRKIAAPQKGAVPRITVQIDPAEQARRLAVLPKPAAPPAGVATSDAPNDAPDGVAALAPVAPATAVYGWFWDTVPTARGAVQGRYPMAMTALSKGPGGSMVRAPRMQQMQDMAQSYGTEILKATIGTNVSPALVLAVIGIESAGRADALSSAGAQGLMQLIPATAARFGVTDATDPVQNIRGGVAYLNWLMQEFDRDPLMVLAAYNAGEGAVRANDGVPP